MADIVAGRIRRMIARGEVTDGQWLPTEPQLMAEFGVSRPTLREAFRLLEADSLVSIRRGPPGGARVTIPGPEAAAAQFGMLLTLSGTTLADIYEARMTIEPAAARAIAERGTAADRKQLAELLEEVRAAADAGRSVDRMIVRFHQSLVELSGNRTLATVTGMLNEIITRHIEQVFADAREPAEEVAANTKRALRAYERLVDLVDARDGEGAEKFWTRHMKAARPYVLKGGTQGATQVVDLLY
ncbi:FadR family transcriptional regulator [Amycolatopsis acidiphila]|uniref:FadR family transcriptional regulator n=2 Tax=Amycolatopsis acidiphila TaxID=715473 RepID=A0A557ZSI1_9PSEU|nr:FadR family transcriptional regulator [Amycolatopsis acidiphila]